jgi:hypothetical protein
MLVPGPRATPPVDFHQAPVLRAQEERAPGSARGTEDCPRLRGELKVGRLAKEGPLPNN